MVKQLRKVGNSQALILDRALLELVGLEENGEVQVTVHDGSIILTPAHPREVSAEQFERALSRVLSRRHGALKRLAE